jgi:hypothetical protein
VTACFAGAAASASACCSCTAYFTAPPLSIISNKVLLSAKLLVLVNGYMLLYSAYKACSSLANFDLHVHEVHQHLEFKHLKFLSAISKKKH